jgi:chromosome segregation ATPase
MTYYLQEHSKPPYPNYPLFNTWSGNSGEVVYMEPQAYQRMVRILQKVYQGWVQPHDHKVALQAKEQQIQNTQSQVNNLCQLVNGLNSQIVTLQNQTKQQEVQLNLSKNTLETFEKSRSQLSTDLERAKSEARAASEKQMQAQQALEKNQSELISQKCENDKQKRTLEEQDDEIKSLKKAILTLQQQNADMQAGHAKETADLKVKHKDDKLKLYKLIDNFLQNFQADNSRSDASTEAPSAESSDNESPAEQ